MRDKASRAAYCVASSAPAAGMVSIPVLPYTTMGSHERLLGSGRAARAVECDRKIFERADHHPSSGANSAAHFPRASQLRQSVGVLVWRRRINLCGLNLPGRHAGGAAGGSLDPKFGHACPVASGCRPMRCGRPRAPGIARVIPGAAVQMRTGPAVVGRLCQAADDRSTSAGLQGADPGQANRTRNLRLPVFNRTAMCGANVPRCCRADETRAPSPRPVRPRRFVAATPLPQADDKCRAS